MVWVRPGVLLVLAILCRQGIDQARLADIGSANEGNFRRAGRRELPGIGSRSNEARQNLHTSNIAGGKESASELQESCRFGIKFFRP